MRRSRRPAGFGLRSFLLFGLSLALTSCFAQSEDPGRPGQPDPQDLGSSPDGASGPDLHPDPEDVAAGRDLADEGAPADLGTPDLGCPTGGCGSLCDLPRPLPLAPDDGRVELTGSTVAGSRPIVGVACPGSGPLDLAGPQRLYPLELAEPGALELELATELADAWLLVLDADCLPAALSCLPRAESLVTGELSPGRYTLVVGSEQATAGGAFTITARQRVPGHLPPGSCLAPTLLPWTEEPVELVGTLRGARDEATASCATTPGVEAVHQVTLPGPGHYRFDLVPEEGWSGRLYARGACADPASELGCAEAGAPLVLAAPGGEIRLFVEAAGEARGGYRLTARRLPDGDGETCAQRRLLLLDQEGRAQVTGDLAAATADLGDSSCGNASLPDLVYGLVLPRRLLLKVQLEAEGFMAVGIRPVCEEPGPALLCSGTGAAKLFDPLAAGDYTIAVRGYPGLFTGPFTLTVEAIDDAQPPANDTCDAPTPLLLDPLTQTARITGTTATARDDLQASCGGENGGDLVYDLTVPVESHLRVQLEAPFDGLVSLRTRCADPATELLCVSAGSEALARFVPAGDVRLIVDGRGSRARGDFTLTVEQLPAAARPLNVDCEHARALPEVVTDGGVELTGNLLDSLNGNSGSCGGGSSPELIYRLDLPTRGRLQVTDASGSYPYLYLRAGTCDGPEEQCGFSRLVLPQLAAGTYFLFIDGSWDPGEIATLVTWLPLGDPPANDRCPEATTLIPDAQGRALFAGDTLPALDDRGASCGGNGANEVFYHLHLPEAAALRVTVDVRSYGWDGVLYLLSDCGPTGVLLGCQDDPEELLLPRLEAGDYWLAVDGYGQQAGRFSGTIQLDRLGPPGPGQSCEQPLETSWDPAQGSLTITGDVAAGAGALIDQGCVETDSLEQIHRLRLLRPTRFGLNLTGDPRVRLAARLSCASDQDGFCLRAGEEQLRELPAGELFLVFRAPVQLGGLGPAPYRLELTPLPAEPSPPGDRCQEPVPLDPSLTRQRLVGTTLGASDLRASACGGTAAGEVAYALTLPQGVRFRATLTGYGFAGALQLVAGDCLAGVPLGCGRDSIDFRLESGTYHLFVDGASPGAAGDFSLVVELLPLPGPGEPCDPAGAGCQAGSFCLATVASPAPTCFAPDPAVHQLWAAELDQGTLIRLDPGSGELLEQLQAPLGLRGPGCGLALDDSGALLLVDGGNPAHGIQRVGPLLGELIATLANPAGDGAVGLGYRDGLLLLADSRTRSLRVLSPLTGQEIRSLDLAQAELLGGLETSTTEGLVAWRRAPGWHLAGVQLPGGELLREVPLPSGPYGGVAQAGPLLYLIQPGQLLVLEAASLRLLDAWPVPLERACGLAGSGP